MTAPAAGLFGGRPRRVLVADVQREVARYFNIGLDDLVSRNRSPKVSRPRQMAYLLARKMTPMSYPRIGQMFGAKCHTSVVHGERETLKRIATDPEWARHYAALKARLA